MRMGACAFNQHVELDYVPVQAPITAGAPVTIFRVADQRQAIVTEDHGAAWLGTLRSNFGVPYPVGTATRRPFAEEVENAIAADLTSLGFTVKHAPVLSTADPTLLAGSLGGDGGRGLAVVVLDWESDTYMTTSLRYRFDVRVLDRTGAVLAQVVVEDDSKLPRHRWRPVRGMKEDLATAYAAAIPRLVRDNRTIVAALAGEPEPVAR